MNYIVAFVFCFVGRISCLFLLLLMFRYFLFGFRVVLVVVRLFAWFIVYINGGFSQCGFVVVGCGL